MGKRGGCLALVVIVALGATQSGFAALIPGGGPAASDCYGAFDVLGASGASKLACTDGDPACDVDGQCQGVCTFAVAVCLNQTSIAGCTPQPLAKAVKVTGAPLSVVTAPDASPVCGPATDVPVALRGKKKPKRGRKKLGLTVVVAGKPARDADRLVLLCTPREGACPTTTSTTTTSTSTAVTTTSSTTSTTVPPLDATVLLTGSRIAAFPTLDPSLIEAPTTLIGMTAGDTLVAIDRRPQNGFLYGLGFNSGAGTVRLYAVHAATGVVTAIGTSGTFVLADGTTPVPIGAGPTTQFGIDFNPTVDRLRVVNSAGQNFRMDPSTGAFVDGNVGTPGLNMDGAINGATTVVQETAYTNNAINATVTTLYTLDQVTDALLIQNPPNNGTQTTPQALSSAVDQVLGFDIAPDVSVATSNTVATGSGSAVLRLTGQTDEVLAAIDLTTGAVSGVLPIGSGGIVALALQKPAGRPMVALLATGTQIMRFTSSAPGTTVTVSVTGLVAGEVLVGIDFRPQTGQLFALGVNDAGNAATTYRLDPQTGAATIVGSPSQVAFVDALAAPVDLPGASVGYGFDFNPAVDRIRVVTGTGLNFRLNPNTGAPVDGDLGGGAVSVAGINPDGNVNGAAAVVDGAAYTNSTGGSLVGGVTTLYTLASATNGLYVQNPPNAGTQTGFVPITLGGAALDFTAANGFDIPSEVRTSVSGSPVTEGSALATLTVNGSTRLYAIDLPTGAATALGTIGAGGTPLSGLAVGQIAVR